ncbi:ribose-phosphate diphosphokinase [Gudongella oleilytica]|jgi:ribose-phosphate pyrophosphokinase|uniref:ribose-phosphate diphosphokinase n=1 Tax=Gudongella oleilytica TaxID=1582259 RepID=UPI000FF886DB|nr:ribose-phosphate pyrophosphokinase [Gudongella oleilytica]HMM69458.1 ribose-phosphate pyrophosphokinase [Gudongella oleilytica]
MNLCLGGVKVFTGNANRDLVKKICSELDIQLGNCEVTHFSDGEINVNIGETVRGCDVYIIQPTNSPVNDNLMELLILIDAVKRASAGRINAVIPYYGYARQDRKTKAREPITAKLVANLITTAGADRVVSMDLHAGQIQGYFDIPVDHLSSIPLLANYFKNIVDEDTVIVSPDLGGVTRARTFANILDLPIAIIEKRRPKANVSEVMNVIGEIEGRNVILVDDIIDTAGTIVKAASVLKSFGAKKVYGCATHGVLSGPALERIHTSELEKFVITDTIPLSDEAKIDKIEVVSVAPLFAEAIKRINSNESVSIIFE